ncbi:MAG: transaldolase family protein [Acidobacteriota bacterium]
MKVFLDTGDVEAVHAAVQTGLVEGVTTNPSLIAKTDRNLLDVLGGMCALVNGPVSAEVMAESAEKMRREACAIASIAPNIVVKIPMTPEGLRIVPLLEKDGIRTNVTMVFSATQAWLAMKSGASFVSIVLSRLDAVGNDSAQLVSDTMLIKRNYGFRSEIIGGSLKTQNHVLCCLRAGVDIATIPAPLFSQLFNHPLTDLGLETFRRDWESASDSARSLRNLETGLPRPKQVEETGVR